jgi:hypothetical protein
MDGLSAAFFSISGVLLAILAIPSWISARIDGRRPALSRVFVFIALGFVVIAFVKDPSSLTLNGITTSFAQIAAWIIR